VSSIEIVYEWYMEIGEMTESLRSMRKELPYWVDLNNA